MVFLNLPRPIFEIQPFDFEIRQIKQFRKVNFHLSVRNQEQERENVFNQEPFSQEHFPVNTNTIPSQQAHDVKTTL